MANEKRLIDVDGFKSAFNAKTKDGNEELLIAHGKVFVAFRVVERALENAPTVDAVEVVHGRWVQIGYDKALDRITCSCCKDYWNIEDNQTQYFNYCPNCGAKMDGDGNG